MFILWLAFTVYNKIGLKKYIDKEEKKEKQLYFGKITIIKFHTYYNDIPNILQNLI